MLCFIVLAVDRVEGYLNLYPKIKINILTDEGTQIIEPPTSSKLLHHFKYSK